MHLWTTTRCVPTKDARAVKLSNKNQILVCNDLAPAKKDPPACRAGGLWLFVPQYPTGSAA